MGWKSYFIVVKPVNAVDDAQILKGFGMGDYSPGDEALFERAIYPEGDEIYIGQFEDCLLICNVVLSAECLTDSISSAEAFLMRTFPHAEIGVFVLQSTVNFWGYAVLADGQKIRVRAGSSDDGLIIEAGEPLAQEMKLLSVSTIEADGRRTYGEYEDEPIEEDQMGEEFVFEMAARFFGERLDQADDDSLFGAKLRRYDPIEVQRMAPRPAVQPEGSDKPWWKFW